MNVRISAHRFSGDVRIPASKSHTIRQLLIASLADGFSEIHYPLDSLDTRSCVSVCRTFGAKITEHRAADSCPNPPDENGEKLIKWTVRGNANFKNKPHHVSTPVDVGNSGTTLYLALAIAGLQEEPIQWTGDEQIKRRSAAALLEALSGLGVYVDSKDGCVPITVKGPWKGGKVSLPCPTSQFLSALLLAAPLAPQGTVTEIEVPLLNERPYVEMTLSYLRAHNIPFEAALDFSHFVIPGGSQYNSFPRLSKDINMPARPFGTSGRVPADFSSAAFPAAAAAITGGPVTLLGLDPQDTQGDKFFFEILQQMGCDVQWRSVPASAEGEQAVTISRSKPLRGGTFGLNETPDLLPAAAAVAAYAHGDTAFVNVAHARIKETDRIAMMAKELAKLGVRCTEKPDGIVIHGKGALSPASSVIDGHGDHRIVMAMAAASLGSPCPLEITSAESAAVTYPGFLELIGVNHQVISKN